MKKKLIMLAVIIACIALCATVWPQNEVVRETPKPTQELTVSAPEAPIATPKGETEDLTQTEEENTESPQPELPMETVPEPEPMPAEIPDVLETQPIPEPMLTETPAVPEAQSIPEPSQTPEPVPDSAPVETVNSPQAGNMVYVQGFGWLESQGAGSVIHDETIYENGNKVGSMG